MFLLQINGRLASHSFCASVHWVIRSGMLCTLSTWLLQCWGWSCLLSAGLVALIPQGSSLISIFVEIPICIVFQGGLPCHLIFCHSCLGKSTPLGIKWDLPVRKMTKSGKHISSSCSLPHFLFLKWSDFGVPHVEMLGHLKLTVFPKPGVLASSSKVDGSSHASAKLAPLFALVRPLPATPINHSVPFTCSC